MSKIPQAALRTRLRLGWKTSTRLRRIDCIYEKIALDPVKTKSAKLLCRGRRATRLQRAGIQSQEPAPATSSTTEEAGV